jgi:hypothetical protein
LDLDRAISVLEAGGDAFKSMVKAHQDEWKDIEQIRVEALLAFKDSTFRPEDASDKWSSKDQLIHAPKLFAIYNTASTRVGPVGVGRSGSGTDRVQCQRRARQGALTPVVVEAEAIGAEAALGNEDIMRFGLRRQQVLHGHDVVPRRLQSRNHSGLALVGRSFSGMIVTGACLCGGAGA